MMTAVLIIVLLIALLALAVVVIVLRSFNSSSENVEIHMSGGADLKRGYVSSDNNYFKGLSGEQIQTVVLDQNKKNRDYVGREIILCERMTSYEYRLNLCTEIVVGRSPVDGVFAVRDVSVSKKHCRIFDGGDGNVYIDDLNSLNHTYLNDEQIKSPRPLSSGDEIRIGNTRFVVVL